MEVGGEARAALRAFLEAEAPNGPSKAGGASEPGYSRELWEKLAQRGALGAAFAKQDLPDVAESPFETLDRATGIPAACLVLEELSRLRIPSPFFTTVLLCGRAVDEFGTDAQRAAYLAPIASGSMILSYADFERGGSWGTKPVRCTARADGAGYEISGEKLFVPYAHVADHFLVTVRLEARPGDTPEGSALFIVDAEAAGITIRPVQTVDRDYYHVVTFEGVKVGAEELLGEVHRGDDLISSVIARWGAAGRCAEMAAAGERVLELALDQVKNRKQFDRPIGSFQAVQHRCADMAVDALSSRLVADAAIGRLSQGFDAAQEVSIAKAWIGEAYSRICDAGHQLHGAVGFTGGHVMHRFFRHSRSASLDFGDAAYHRDLLARELRI